MELYSSWTAQCDLVIKVCPTPHMERGSLAVIFLLGRPFPISVGLAQVRVWLVMVGLTYSSAFITIVQQMPTVIMQGTVSNNSFKMSHIEYRHGDVSHQFRELVQDYFCYDSLRNKSMCARLKRMVGLSGLLAKSDIVYPVTPEERRNAKKIKIKNKRTILVVVTPKTS